MKWMNGLKVLRNGVPNDLNIAATLYALVCGLFISRWVLAALGKTDFGLYGVVGGMAVFISFLNML